MKKLSISLIVFSMSHLFAQQEACTIDAEKFCSGFTSGEPQLKKCLKDHVHELSPDCKDYQVNHGKELFKKNEKTDKNIEVKKNKLKKSRKKESGSKNGNGDPSP